MNLACHLPLHEKKSWDEAGRAIEHLLGLYKKETAGIKKSARSIYHSYSELFPVLDGLCRNTCQFCPTPCCLKAKIWFDLKDMLILKLCDITLPDAQPIGHPNDTCRYLGPKGCKLDRYERPFICTLYLCPPQMARLRKDNHTNQTVSKLITAIKSARKEIENEFVNITA